MAEQVNKAETLLEVKNLTLHYTSDRDVVRAVNGVSFRLGREKTLGLVGETGAGKTSIAKAILGVLPERSAKIDGGEILFDGRDLLKLSENEMNKVRGFNISMIFQDPMTALNPTRTIGSQIAECILIHNKVDKKESNERAMKMLERVGISRNRFHEYPHQFSGGMKQRVIIAMALACYPDLLLADEPTTALDVTIEAQVLDIIRELRAKYKTSMILITHDLGVVAQMCDEVAVVYAGQIVEWGPLREVFKNPRHPYTIGLFGALPNMNVNSKRLATIKGLPPDPTNLPDGCKFHPRCKKCMEECRIGEIDYVDLGNGHFCKCVKVRKEQEEAQAAGNDSLQ